MPDATKVETLSGVAEHDRRIDVLPDERANAVSWWLTHHGLNKARIIHPAGPDAKPYIVTREVLDEAHARMCDGCSLAEECDGQRTDCDTRLAAILTALGPFVVADEVVTVVRRREEQETVYHDEWYEYLGKNRRGQKVIQRALGGMMRDGDTIYIKRRESGGSDE